VPEFTTALYDLIEIVIKPCGALVLLARTVDTNSRAAGRRLVIRLLLFIELDTSRTRDTSKSVTRSSAVEVPLTLRTVIPVENGLVKMRGKS
jgi:hypothetical protein